MTSPGVFLSHSGAAAAAARELKRRLENAPDAKKVGLEPGTPWSAQIAHAIQNEATAFVVYVGSSGVINLGRSGGRTRDLARDHQHATAASLHSGSHRRKCRVERPSPLCQAVPGRPRSARQS